MKLSEKITQAMLEGQVREAALMAKLEAAEKEVEIERMRLAACGVAALGYFEGCAEEYMSASLNDVLALRAEVEAMEKQEPYAFAVTFPETARVELVNDLDALYEDMITESYEVRNLYLAPGAKGEEK